MPAPSVQHAAPIQVVWFKRDLRVRDHAPLVAAALRGPVLPLYIVEPALLAAPDFAPAHWSFIAECLHELRRDLAHLGQPLIVRVGEPTAILAQFTALLPISQIWVYEETSNMLGYRRDQAVRRWARAQGVRFTELPQRGIVRRLASRDAWEAAYEQTLAQPTIPPPVALVPVRPALSPGPIPTHAELGLAPDTLLERQQGGSAQAHRLLDDFLYRRASSYQWALSSPNTAWDGCSRLSPFLAWGALSHGEVIAATQARIAPIAHNSDPSEAQWLRALHAFVARLRWRCHFMQKLEDAPTIEEQNLVRAFDEMRPEQPDPTLLEAWATGNTGYPFVDACMRALHATGWLNFRMRAMLVSFACFDLWQHWRAPGLVLARAWLDYEPGIHYSQLQMQSGTAGNATLRIYNPVKQGQDHDPEGAFVRRWVPELAGVPRSFVHAPWLMPRTMQISVGCVVGRTYPAPLIDHEAMARRARAAITAVRHRPGTAEQIAAVHARHGSRRPIPQRRTSAAIHPGQLRLDL
jgi:deoxyribodipyrimidine photo-lyase